MLARAVRTLVAEEIELTHAPWTEPVGVKVNGNNAREPRVSWRGGFRRRVGFSSGTLTRR